MDPCLPSRFVRFVLRVSCALAILTGWATAAERIKVSPPPESSPTSPLMAGKLRQSTTTWLQYPGACFDRYAGTWAGRSTPQADSLNTYTAGGTGPYTVLDQSISEIVWHVSDNATCTSGTNCPPALSGSRMLWCGKFDANWVVQYGYPNFTYQILYIDTGTHAGNYNFVLTYRINTEQNYDYAYLIGGGDGLRDPVGNSRPTLDHVIADGSSGNIKLLVQWTGSISPGTTNALGANTTASPPAVQVIGAADQTETTVSGASFVIEAQHRALYLVIRSDCFVSSEDGLWSNGHGPQIDNLSVSDNGALYTDEAAPTSGGLPVPDTGPGVTPGGGIVLKGTSSAPTISARVGAGIGTLWQLVHGSNLPTPDVCTPKNETGGNTNPDLIFEGGNVSTFHTIPNQATSIVSCTFPVPVGTASVIAQWSEYLDLPAYQGYLQFAEYRYFRDGFWSTWRNTDGGGTRRVGGLQAWGGVRSELAEASRADSVQLRYSIRCVPETSADHANCGDVTYGVLYDDLRLEAVSGVPAPVFGIYPAFLAQSTFVDGTMPSPGNCVPATVAAGQCWPGIRGSDIGTAAAVHDNFNSPLGDSIVLSIGSGLRRNGKGLNWHHGFDRSVGAGLTIAHTNPNFVSSFDKPRVIYRLFDPTTKTWSPLDSSELDANAVALSGVDTVLIDSKFRMNWPPRDKLGSVLPGGFTINGQGAYSALSFLPRGTRLQYYFKGVDINGGRTYQFSSDFRALEVEDLPTLPGSSIRAPDIIEFDVLPGAYPAGAPGTLLDGRTNTPILNLDGVYTAWGAADPVTQALRALGVRADRYRALQGTEQGSNIGGHEFAGTRSGRLANYFPNMDEYPIKALLASSYRIMIESSHVQTSFSVLEESGSKLLKQWWLEDTGPDGGDRCLLSTGDDFFSILLAVGGVPHPNEGDLATDVFGVAATANQWNGGNSVRFPAISDMFADPASGPALGTPGAYKYIVDGGCPLPNRFDALTKVGAGTQNSATYPAFMSVTNVAGVSNMIAAFPGGAQDHDRNKALGYGFSIGLIRQGGMNLADTRAQVLYKFLTSCRGARVGGLDTASCWPCPTPANKYGNWASLTGFQQATYGPLYPIQDATRVLTGIGDPVPETPRFVNALSQNRPNPFNPETIVPFSVATKGKVTIRIYDISGRCIKTLVDSVKEPGVHQARWTGELDSGGKAASSIYFYKITYPDGTSSARKMAILR